MSEQVQSPDSAETSEVALAPTLPPAAAMLQAGMQRLTDLVVEARTGRKVAVPEDAYPLIRQLDEVSTGLGFYERAFRELRRVTNQYAEEEALEAYGEDDAAHTRGDYRGAGVPAKNVYVPVEGGRVILERQFDYTNDADWQQALAVLCTGLVAELVADGKVDPDDEHVLAHWLPVVAPAVLARVQRVAKVEPSASGWKAYGEALAAKGLDQAASVWRTALRSRRLYRGLRMTDDGGRPKTKRNPR